MILMYDQMLNSISLELWLKHNFNNQLNFISHIAEIYILIIFNFVLHIIILILLFKYN
jgi:hypothetical protein